MARPPAKTSHPRTKPPSRPSFLPSRVDGGTRILDARPGWPTGLVRARSRRRARETVVPRLRINGRSTVACRHVCTRTVVSTHARTDTPNSNSAHLHPRGRVLGDGVHDGRMCRPGRGRARAGGDRRPTANGRCSSALSGCTYPHRICCHAFALACARLNWHVQQRE